MQVRRQFAERPGIMTYAEKPDYARCVSIVATSALQQMVKPGLLAVLAPCVVSCPSNTVPWLQQDEALSCHPTGSF